MTAILDYSTGDYLLHGQPFDFPMEFESDEAEETHNPYEPAAVSYFARTVCCRRFFCAQM